MMSFAFDQTTTISYGSEESYRPKLNEHECYRLLWIKVILRAAYDWVLYRNSKNSINRKIAKDAYSWLFEATKTKKKFVVNGEVEVIKIELFNSLENICGFLELDVDSVRKFARTLTREDIKKQEFLERTSNRRKLEMKLRTIEDEE